MALTFVDDTEHSRFNLLRDGDQVGLIDYVIKGDAIHLTHTFIDPSKRERGLAASFVQLVLDSLRGGSLRLVPDCPFVAHWLTEHPEYNDLL
jgi:predicted GNAT family acetyltransferase